MSYIDEYLGEKTNEFSIEEHGPKGNYALYRGRSMKRHGLNLCCLSDFDHAGESTRQLIVKALNEYMRRQNVKK